MESKPRWSAATILDVLVLTALNLSICWRLFKVEYTGHFNSIEGAFISIARYIGRHPGDFSWWPLWHCGMPYQNTYVPLLHRVVASVASISSLSAAQAYHDVIAVAYSLGAAALYLMAVRLGASRGAAFISALAYSLFSPSTLVMHDVVRDIGGFWYARRLQVMTVWGEGPHVSSMTLAPIAILALENALAKRTPRAFALAAIAIALVFLTNVPGTMALGLAVFCWICAQPRERYRKAWVLAAAASVLAYGLACYGVPPSSELTVAGNAGSMHPGFTNSLKYGPIWLALVFVAVAAGGRLLARTRLPLVARYAALYSALMAVLVLTSHFETFELLPQVGRLHLELEIGMCLLFGLAAWTLYALTPRWVRPVLWALALAPVLLQWKHYRASAHGDASRVDVAARSEYTTARWLDAHMNGRRVYATGSTSFWLNAFTDTPQLTGCCDQGQSMPVLSWLPYLVNAGTTPEYTDLAKSYLQALGVHAIAVNGPQSTDEYKDFKEPQRFDRVFPVLHRENGDTIYSVLPDSVSLAHVLRPGEQVPVRPKGAVEHSDVVKYAALITGNSHPPASLEWARNGDARIRAQLHRDDLVSVQVAWVRGWKAFANGRHVGVSQDGLGFILIQPQCEGNCEVSLVWTGPWDLWLSAGVSIVSVLIVGVALWAPWRRRYAKMERMIAVAPEVKPRYQFKPGPYSSHTLLLAHFAAQGEGRRVLDIGCAAGYLSEILAHRGFSVASIDWPGTPHPATVEFSGTDLDYGIGPVEGLFEYVICGDVLEHLRDPLRVLTECRERLAPGGTLLVSMPNSAHWYFRWNVLIGRFPQHEHGLFDSTHLHFYTWRSLADLLDRAGFRIESARSSAVPFGLALPLWEGTWIVRALERVSFELARAWKTLFAYQFIVRARARE